jgi:hypothetical protein
MLTDTRTFTNTSNANEQTEGRKVSRI